MSEMTNCPVSTSSHKASCFIKEFGVLCKMACGIKGGCEVMEYVADFFGKIVPDEFFSMPASKSGDFHHESENGIGGLVLHTRRAFLLAQELFKVYNFTDEEEFIILVSLLLHDTFKYVPCDNERKHSNSMHPIAASLMFKGYTVGNVVEGFGLVEKICECIETHSGNFGDYYGDVTIPVPKTRIQNFVHLCDYIASRKFVKIEVDDYTEKNVENND